MELRVEVTAPFELGQLAVASNRNAIDEDLRHRALSSRLDQPSSQLGAALDADLAIGQAFGVEQSFGRDAVRTASSRIDGDFGTHGSTVDLRWRWRNPPRFLRRASGLRVFAAAGFRRLVFIDLVGIFKARARYGEVDDSRARIRPSSRCRRGLRGVRRTRLRKTTSRVRQPTQAARPARIAPIPHRWQQLQ